MDKELEFKIQLKKKGDEIFSIIKRLIEREKTAIGIELKIDDSYIYICSIFGEYYSNNLRILRVTINNPCKNRLNAIDAVRSYLINHKRYIYDMQDDYTVSNTSVICFYF